MSHKPTKRLITANVRASLLLYPLFNNNNRNNLAYPALVIGEEIAHIKQVMYAKIKLIQFG